MSGNEIDYQIECELYLKLRNDGENVTQADFCKRRSIELGKSVSIQYFRKKMCILRKRNNKKKRPAAKSITHPGRITPTKADGYDWPELKKDFLSGGYKTLSEFARAKGLPPDATWFRVATKGWVKERRQFQEVAEAKTIDALAKSRAAEKARDVLVEALATHYKIMDLINESAEQSVNWEEKHKTPWYTREVLNVAIIMQKALKEVIPSIQGLEKLSQVQDIFKGLKDGTMDISQAAIEFAALGVEMPTPVKMLLAKHVPEEDAPADDGEEITEEMILARRAKMMAEIETERVSFVQERTRVVAELKQELAGSDSFAAQAMEEDGAETP